MEAGRRLRREWRVDGHADWHQHPGPLYGESAVARGALRSGPQGSFDEAVVDTHVELILSPSHLRAVQKSLAEDPGSSGPATLASPSPFSDRAQRPWSKMLSDAFFGANDEPPSSPTTGSSGEAVPEESEPIDFEDLQQNLNVYKEQHSRVVAVTFTSENPQMAAVIANRVAEMYVNRGRDRLQARRERLEKELAERIPPARAAVERAEAAVRDHRMASGLIDQKSVESMDQQIAELRRQLAIDLARLGERGVRLSALLTQQDQEGPRADVLSDGQPANAFPLATEAETDAADAGHQVAPLQREELSRLLDEVLAELPFDRRALGSASTALGNASIHSINLGKHSAKLRQSCANWSARPLHRRSYTRAFCGDRRKSLSKTEFKRKHILSLLHCHPNFRARLRRPCS